MADLDELFNVGDPSSINLDSIKTQVSSYIEDKIETEKTGLNNKNKQLLKTIKDLKANQLPDDFDMDQYNAMVEEHSKAEELKQQSRTDFENMKAELLTNHQTEIEKLTGEISRYKSGLEQQVIDNAAIMAINAEKGNAELLLPHVKSQLRMVEEDGKFHTQVFDGNDVRYDGESGNPMTLKQLVNEMKAKDTYAPAFMQENKGSNVNFRDSKGTNMPNPFKKGSPHYNLTEQAKLRKSNPELAAAMAKQA